MKRTGFQMVPPGIICSPGLQPKDSATHLLRAHKPQDRFSTPSRHIPRETGMMDPELSTLFLESSVAHVDIGFGFFSI